MIRQAEIKNLDSVYSLICDMEQSSLDICEFKKIFINFIHDPRPDNPFI